MVSGCAGPSMRALLIVLAAAFASGCVTTPAVPCRADEQAVIMESLYFGTEMPSGRVREAEWKQFLAEVITPRFPNGLTSWSASGQWRGASGELAREESFVLQVTHPAGTTHDRAVREIMDEYKKRFQQEAVLRVRTPACISF